MEEKTLYFGPPGILYFFCKFLVNAFEVSICAKDFFGPITSIPALHKASETPLASGFSGPIIASCALISLHNRQQKQDH